MMNIVNETSQRDDDQVFLPQKLEQDYLSCLLSADDIVLEEIENEMLNVELEQESVSDVSGQNNALPTDRETSKGKTAAEQYMSLEKLTVSAPFVCQLMLISGVKFAVPLANFSRVIAVPENVKVNSNTASACFGTFDWQNKSMFLLAIKQIMQSTNTNQHAVLGDNDKIVLIEEDNFGFVCNQMLETVTISPEDVLWRDESSQRYWLAGMVKAAGFAILDVKGILRSATGSR